MAFFAVIRQKIPSFCLNIINEKLKKSLVFVTIRQFIFTSSIVYENFIFMLQFMLQSQVSKWSEIADCLTYLRRFAVADFF